MAFPCQVTTICHRCFHIHIRELLGHLSDPSQIVRPGGRDSIRTDRTKQEERSWSPLRFLWIHLETLLPLMFLSFHLTSFISSLLLSLLWPDELRVFPSCSTLTGPSIRGLVTLTFNPPPPPRPFQIP